MSTARKYNSNQRSMSAQSRHKAYAKINIIWEKLRPDLKWEAKEEKREQLLEWIVRLLDLKKLDSIKDLTDGQIGLVIDEMMDLQQIPKTKHAETAQSRTDNVIRVDFTKKNSAEVSNGETGEIIFTSSEPQEITLGKLADYIWKDNTERRNKFLTDRKFGTNFKLLPFDQATALTMILMNIAAQKDLKSIHSDGKPISRTQINKYIPTLKKKLGIDQK